MNEEIRVAIVTGGGTGIGAAIVKGLSEDGYRVVVAGRRREQCEAAAAAAPSAIQAMPHPCDVSDKESVRQLVDTTLAQFGRIDVLVNSAGTNCQKRTVAEVGFEDWERILRVNATGAFYCIQGVLPTMRRQGSGVIVNICSVAGLRAIPIGGVAYNASKFAMNALGTTVGEEERHHGIRVTNVHPGEVETPILDARPTPVTKEHRARILQPEDVADAVRMVCALPKRARVPELVIVPTSQSFA